MEPRAQVLLVGASSERERQVGAALSEVADVEAAPAPTLEGGRQLGNKLILVDLTEDQRGGLHLMEEIEKHAPGTRVIALAGSHDPELILEAMRRGSRGFAVLSRPGELAATVTELLSRSDGDHPQGQIITVLPVKGGVGATTITVNLADAMCGLGKRVVVVDLDLLLGDVLLTLDVQSRYTIADVLRHTKRLDRELLDASLAHHQGSGIFVVAQTDHPEEAAQISAARVSTLLQFLAGHFDVVLVDGAQGFGELTQAAVAASARLLLVMVQDLPALKSARRWVELLGQLGVGADKVQLLVNRYESGRRVDLQAIEEHVGIPAQHHVANDYRAISHAVEIGRLLSEVAPRSRVVTDLQKVALALVGGKTRPRGLWDRLFHRAPEPVAAAATAKEE